MRKVIAIVTSVVILLTLSILPVSAVGGWTVDIGNPASEGQAGIGIAGWGPVEPATSGGNWGGFDVSGEDCRTTWELPNPEESLRCASVTYSHNDCVFPTYLEWRILDGIADDSYEIYVDSVLVYTYTDLPPIDDPEAWSIVGQDLSGFSLPNDVVHIVEFCATGQAWGSFATYGQLGVDWVTLTTEPCDGNTTVDTTVTVVSSECICINVTPDTLDFGVVVQGGESELADALTVSNCGNVDADVTAEASTTFYQDNLYLEGSSWDSLATWGETVAESGAITFGAKLVVPGDAVIDTYADTLVFTAVKSTP